MLQAQGAKQNNPETKISDPDADHVEQRNAWFYRGRIFPGKPTAQLRHHAYQSKVRMRGEHAAVVQPPAHLDSMSSTSGGAWMQLGPVPLASDATGNGTQDYHQVAGRATSVVIDPADPTGNTVYVGGAQSGVWKSTTAAASTAATVSWTPLTDDQATLSVGALAIQPGNNDITKTVILAATGEADNSGDSYFGLGILRSADAGDTWSLISTANSGSFSFSGLGGTRMAFSTATPTTVVAAMATTSEGTIAGAVTGSTQRGLYTSLDAGQTWTYDALLDSSVSTDATSATSVVYNAAAGKFFAAVRYHGFYSSPDGANWTRLSAQPGGNLLTTAACPPQSTSNGSNCPIYRAELTTVANRNEMYAWFVYFSSLGAMIDGGIWQSLNGGNSWTQISDSGISNCGDTDGCGIEQGSYNLELLAVPNCPVGSPNCGFTDLYAGAINLYKCGTNAQNATCNTSPFLNLTHVYGCDPIGAPAHVHPDQHALAYTILNSGADLMYFANDGGIYRALNAFSGLTTGSCSGTNQFDDLNQSLGSMTQFVSFSQHPTDEDTLLGGTQDNGSPASNQATTNASWSNVLGGDGGYNAIDPNATSNFYASNPDIPPGDLAILRCGSGVNCIDSSFGAVITSSTVGGDDGAFYFPFILDPQSTSALIVGTCRIWRGPRNGGTFSAISSNFDTLGSGTCSGSEVNLVRAVAAGGATDSNGSTVVYATTSGNGPLNGPLASPTGGRVWVTTNATGGPSNFTDVTANGPQGSINPNQFPISNVAIDSFDPSGQTAYVTVMGFTGGTGHVWKTTNAGITWTDFTGNLPDSPANAVVIDSTARIVYVGTDVGVFSSSTSSPPNWTEVGPTPGPSQTGFLPNVAVTALGIFNYGPNEYLRASTYGRGIWQFTLRGTPDYRLAISNSPLTTFLGHNTAFTGTASAINGYSNSVTMECVAGSSPPPSTCTVSPSVLTPTSNPSFSVTAGGAVGDYTFNVEGVGSDSSQTTHLIPVTLHVVSFGISSASPTTVSVPRGTTSSVVSFQVTGAGSFNQSVALACTDSISNAVCNFSPASTVNPTSSSPVSATVTVTVPAGTSAGNYLVTIRATTAGAPSPATTSFTVAVTTNPDFILTGPSSFPEVNAGSTGTHASVSITSQDGFSSAVALGCSGSFGTGVCSVSPSSVSSFPSTATLTVNGTSLSAGSYSASVTGTAGSDTHVISVPFNVGDYSITGPATLSVTPGGHGTENLTITSKSSYAGQLNATCDASALAAASCSLSQSMPMSVPSGSTATLTASVNVPSGASTGKYNIKVSTQDTTGAPSHTFTFSIVVGQDFALVSSPPNQSQTVSAGQTTGAYNLTLEAVGSSFSGSVALACSGLPSLAQCQFNPPSPITLTSGSSTQSVVMTITTTAATASALPSTRVFAVWAISFPATIIGLIWQSGRPKKKKRVGSLSSFLIVMLTLILASCGGASTGGGAGGGGQPGTPAGTYAVTVSGSSSGIPADSGQHTEVTLVVN